MDRMKITVEANKNDAFSDGREAFERLMELKAQGISCSLIQRFDDVWYVVTNDWSSDTDREHYFD